MEKESSTILETIDTQLAACGALSNNHVTKFRDKRKTPRSVVITLKTADELVSTVEESARWLQDIEDAKAHFKPAPDRWSISEVIGHLLDSACNNHQRFVRAQFQDSFTFPDYKQNQWVAANSYREQDWQELIELWRLKNRSLARVMRKIPVAKLSTSCTITPYETCTLEFLVTDYLDHLNHHLNKIEERVSVDTTNPAKVDSEIGAE